MSTQAGLLFNLRNESGLFWCCWFCDSGRWTTSRRRNLWLFWLSSTRIRINPHLPLPCRSCRWSTPPRLGRRPTGSRPRWQWPLPTSLGKAQPDDDSSNHDGDSGTTRHGHNPWVPTDEVRRFAAWNKGHRMTNLLPQSSSIQCLL